MRFTAFRVPTTTTTSSVIIRAVAHHQIVVQFCRAMYESSLPTTTTSRRHLLAQNRLGQEAVSSIGVATVTMFLLFVTFGPSYTAVLFLHTPHTLLGLRPSPHSRSQTGDEETVQQRSSPPPLFRSRVITITSALSRRILA